MATKKDVITAARHTIERVYFRMYADRILAGQMQIDDLPEKMARACQAFEQSLAALENGQYPLEATQKAVATERDYITEYKRAVGIT